MEARDRTDEPRLLRGRRRSCGSSSRSSSRPGIHGSTPTAGFVGALLIGLAVGLTMVPLFWLAVFARHRRIAYRGDWTRAIRRGGWVAIVVGRLRHPPSPGRCSRRPSPCSSSLSSSSPSRCSPSSADRRPTGRDREPARDRSQAAETLPPEPLPDRAAPRPAAPHEAMKARLAAAVDAARDEILELSHRIHAHPEPAFEERQAAAWIAEALRAPRVRGRASGGHASRPRSGRHRGGRRARGGDRAPRIGILAEYDALPGPRPRLRPQHDGGLGGRRGDRPGGDRGRAPGRDRLPRHARPRSGGAASRS